MQDEKQLGKAPTISIDEMHSIAAARVHEISKEFTDGFEFLEDFPKSVTFFGSGQFDEGNIYYESARALSNRIVKELGYSVVGGGGPGIMEGANRGAYEAGGESIGLNIQLPDGQRMNDYITKATSFYYFFVRKVCLSFSAEAFIFYPGGFGTLDEFFEILTLVQTKKIENVPIICIGSRYWNSLKEFMENEMLRQNAIIPDDLKHFSITDDHNEVIEIIKQVPVRSGVPRSGRAPSASR